MSYYFRDGNTFFIADKRQLDLHDKLPVGNYMVEHHPMKGFFLVMVDPFPIPKRLYGNIDAMTDRVLVTYNDRINSTGIILNGEKGSGKTLFAKVLSHKCATRIGAPTVIVNNPYHGDAFNKFIQNIDQPCIVLFDEFEKVYAAKSDEDKELRALGFGGGSAAQSAMLTLLDGVYPSRKLFVLTCNDKYRIDNHMRNRPGRLFYNIDFSGLEEGFIRQYAQECLKPELRHHVDAVVMLSSVFEAMNFDMLASLVEEMNRFGDSPQEAVKMLNIKLESHTNARYDVSVKINGVNLSKDKINPDEWAGNPLQSQNITIGVLPDRPDHAGEDDGEWVGVDLKPSMITHANIREGVVIFRNPEHKAEVVFRKRKYQSYFESSDFYGGLV